MPELTIAQIHKSIKEKKIAPVYYLYGEESYFIDKLVQLLEASVLNQTEAAFNKKVFYGPDSQAHQIINECRSFPVMSAYRLIVLKEGQKLKKPEWDKLLPYLSQPVSTSVLVLTLKGKKGGLNKKGIQAINKYGVSFSAKKMYEKDVIKWVQGHLSDLGWEFDPSIPEILVSNLGTNIQFIENEIEKMVITLKARKETSLNKEFVYDMINIDKSFNVFELTHAICMGDTYKSHLIIDRMAQNEKVYPPILTINALFRLFDGIAQVHTHQLKDVNSIKYQLGVNYYAAKDYNLASKRYSQSVVYDKLLAIREADLKLKGIMPGVMNNTHILKTLILKLLN